MSLRSRSKKLQGTRSTNDGIGKEKVLSKHKEGYSRSERGQRRNRKHGSEGSVDSTESGSSSENVDQCGHEVTLDAFHSARESVERSESASPRLVHGQSCEDKKAKSRLSLWLSDFSFVQPTRRSHKMVHEHKKEFVFHYFWGSRFFTTIYGVVVVAVVMREPLVLFGIPLVVLWFMLWQAVAWFHYMTDGREKKDVIKFLEWWTRFALKRVRDAVVNGDALAIFGTLMTMNFWSNGFGKNMAVSVSTSLSRQSYKRVLKHTKDVLVQNTRAFNAHSKVGDT